MQWKLMVERTKKNVSKKEISGLLKITPESYAMKEKGKTQFKANEMFFLSDYFGKTLNEIFLPTNFESTDNIK